jgi:Novel toxin 15
MEIFNTAIGRIKTRELPYPQYSGMRYPPKTAQEIEQFEAGKRDGFLGELKAQALSAGSLILDSFVQLGDVLTLGMNHKTSAIQEVWQRQAGRGDSIVNAAKGLGNAVAHPIDTVTGMAQGVAEGFQKYEDLTKAGNFYEAGKMQGEVVAGMVDPGKGAGKVGKIGKLGDKVDDVTPPKKNGEVVIKSKKTRLVKPKCFKNGSKSSHTEYETQLRAQQKALNDMSVEDYLKNRDRYEEMKRMGTRAEQAAARAKAIADNAKTYSDTLRSQGMPKDLAIEQGKQMAQNAAKGMDILHNPDLIAGGSPHGTGDLGEAGANRSIGSQWNKDDRLDELNKAAKDVKPEDRKNTKMNVELNRCPP